jgi:hypothetical protein
MIDELNVHAVNDSFLSSHPLKIFKSPTHIERDVVFEVISVSKLSNLH